MRVRFLGTGTSFGVPVVGCDCAVCTSEDPRNRRTRHGLLVEGPSGALLVDTPPELRLQLLREDVSAIDGVFLTHLHADHLHGIDDLRIFSMRGRGPLEMYVAAEHESDLRARFPYIFDEAIRPIEGTSAPRIDLRTFNEDDRLDVAGLTLLPLAFPHGNTRSYGFRVGSLGVVVDAKNIPEPSREKLQGITTLVINALFLDRSHPTHLSVEEAVEVAGDLGPQRAYLTHLTHRIEYETLKRDLPDGIEPAYDGLVVEID